jgi:hypothetical protein
MWCLPLRQPADHGKTGPEKGERDVSAAPPPANANQRYCVNEILKPIGDGKYRSNATQ